MAQGATCLTYDGNFLRMVLFGAAVSYQLQLSVKSKAKPFTTEARRRGENKKQILALSAAQRSD